jgi:hypothetical protein
MIFQRGWLKPPTSKGLSSSKVTKSHLKSWKSLEKAIEVDHFKENLQRKPWNFHSVSFVY